MSDVLDRFKKIPPWGYALIAVGVLVLTLLMKNKGGGSSNQGVTQTIAPVDPSAETASNDALNRMQEMYNNLSYRMDQNVIGDANLQAGLTVLTGQVQAMKTATPPAPTSIPASHQVYQSPPVSHTPAPAPSGHWYTIKRGDTLSQIALDTYHRNPYNGDINKIASANHIPNPNRIYAGSKIWIPA